MMKLLAPLIAALAFTVPAQAFDYRDEVLEYTVKPCVLEVAKSIPLTTMKLEHLADVMAYTEREIIDHVIKDIEPLLRDDPPLEKRKLIYRAAFTSCVEKGTKAPFEG